MRRRNIPILTLFVVFISTVALAQGPGVPPGAPGGPGGGPGQGHQGRQDVLFNFLQLTEEQRVAWEGLVNANRDAMQPLHEEMRSLHEELRAAIESDTPDALAIGNLTIAIHQLKEEQRASHEALEESLAALLNPDQLIRYEAFQAARAMMGPGPGGKGPDGPGGPGGGRGCRNC